MTLFSRLSIFSILICFTNSKDVFSQDEKPLTVNRIRENHYARLVAAYYSEGRAQNLVAEFVPENSKANPKKIVVKFPAHSFTPQEATIQAVIRSSIKWDGQLKTKYKRHEAFMHPVFSIPIKHKGFDFSKWYLLRIEQKEK